MRAPTASASSTLVAVPPAGWEIFSSSSSLPKRSVSSARSIDGARFRFGSPGPRDAKPGRAASVPAQN